jgi:hypothetical protein
MRDAEFREWLGRRSFQGSRLTAKGVDGRVRKAPRLERALEELGFSERDLDAVHANGRWPELVKAVSRVAANWRSDEAAARKMAPQALWCWRKGFIRPCPVNLPWTSKPAESRPDPIGSTSPLSCRNVALRTSRRSFAA